MAVVEMTITTSLQTVNIGGGVMANVETYNMTVPGPTIELEVGDTLIVRLINNLPHPTGIHWHGLELHNHADGTPVTQNAVPGGPIQILGDLTQAGGTYLYKFEVPRAGIFWYHPHHYHSTNRTFRGLYGMIIVKDPAAENALVPGTGNGVIPADADTHQLVLSDVTVCKMPMSNDSVNYGTQFNTAEWLGSQAGQTTPSPATLCDMPTAVDENGMAGSTQFQQGDIPNTQTPTGNVNDGQTVLTNGVEVEPRGGFPGPIGGVPAAVPVTFPTELTVDPGQGVRFQIVNCSTSRYFRLKLTDNGGTQIDLIRIGGEAGLLNDAVRMGGSSVGPGMMDFEYEEGEIVLGPAARADVVASIPAGAALDDVLTMWTRDFAHLGQGTGFRNTPSVPVYHMRVSGTPVTPFSLVDGDGILSSIGASFPSLPTPTDSLIIPVVGEGSSDPNINLTSGMMNGGPGIDNEQGSFSGNVPYNTAPHLVTSRWAKEDDVLELTVTNTTGTHHPFHLHGFSFQPISLTPSGGGGSYTWPYTEFVDVQDIPGNYILTLWVHIEDRPFPDGVTMGGAYGRWLFHCHIFFHAHRGMLSELVIAKSATQEKPYIDVNGSWAYGTDTMSATRTGTYTPLDANVASIVAHLENGTPIGTINFAGGNWSWDSPLGLIDQITYIYVTIIDTAGCVDQTVFRMKIGGADDGSDNGDPHIRCVDGTKYDFQSVGEFTLLRDYEGLNVQTRQTPVLTANPITDSYSGIKACVSLNTAMAAVVGSHRVSYQPGRKEGTMIFYLDGKPVTFTEAGFDLDGCTVRGFDANNGGNALGLRINYEHNVVVRVTPRFWNSHQLWYLNISISRTQAEEGLMGPIAPGSWLPKLNGGGALGPKPVNIADRYTDLYKTFADSWRLTNNNSLFVYEPGESTATFTDKNWPAQKPPCKLLPQFEIPGAPLPKGMPVKDAEQVCKGITEGDLFADCVFDVATTGDKTFADGYRVEQSLRLRGSAVQILSDLNPSQVGKPVFLLANVGPIKRTQQVPTGTVVFYVDDRRVSEEIKLSDEGQAQFEIENLDIGLHKIRAEYSGSKIYDPSVSPNLLQDVVKP